MVYKSLTTAAISVIHRSTLVSLIRRKNLSLHPQCLSGVILISFVAMPFSISSKSGDAFLDLVQKCAEPRSRTALVGLGGVGKSQLAIEYCYQVKEKSPDTWVFWVHASDPARFEEGYRKIAERVKPPGWNDPKANILRLVCNRLSDEGSGKWSMVVDNADDSTST